jgi:hypothetical protein
MICCPGTSDNINFAALRKYREGSAFRIRRDHTVAGGENKILRNMISDRLFYPNLPDSVSA